MDWIFAHPLIPPSLKVGELRPTTFKFKLEFRLFLVNHFQPCFLRQPLIRNRWRKKKSVGVKAQKEPLGQECFNSAIPWNTLTE